MTLEQLLCKLPNNNTKLNIFSTNVKYSPSDTIQDNR